MAALPGGEFVGTADMTAAIPSELIAPFIEQFNLPFNVGLLIVSALPGMGTVPSRVVRWNDLTLPTVVRAGGESDTFNPIDIDTTSSEVTPVLKGFVTKVTDEVVPSVLPPGAVPAGALAQLIRKAMQFIDVDILDTSLSATNISGTDVTIFNQQAFRDCMHTMIALENEQGRRVFVGGHSAFQDLRDDFTESMAQQSQFIQQSIFEGTNNAFAGNLYGIDLWESGNVAVEGAGFSNFLVTIGGNVVIGYVRNEQVRVEATRGDSSAERALTQYVIRWWDGVDLFRQDGIVECRSR
jgi:hypothetical protein